MNAKRILVQNTIIVLIIALLAAACAPAATPAPIAVAPKSSEPKLSQPKTASPKTASPKTVSPKKSAPVAPVAEIPISEIPISEMPPASQLPAPTQSAMLGEAPAPLATAVAAYGQPQPVSPVLASPPPADNYFKDYGVNPFVDPREDNLSTFALDVDTASYSVARRYVMDGNLPPAEAVRLEEFVNYFNADYPKPEDVAFAIYADGAPSPFQRDGEYVMRVGIQGYDVPDDQRKPASLTFVIDVSGSMDMENRLGLVKQSLQLLVNRLRPTDSVAIVVFGTSAHVVINPTSGEDQPAILDAIYSLQPEGVTNAEAGLRLGYKMANLAYRPGGINRVILCSDGVANSGATDPGVLLEEIRGYADNGITLTTVGFGMGNFNDTLMEQLADKGDGNYAYVDTLEEAQRLFVDNLTSTLQVIAKDAKVQVDFNADVVARYRLMGYENRAIADQDFRNNAVDAGEIGAGHSVTALYAVLLNPGSQGRIATVQMRWQDPQDLKVREINGNFNTWDLASSFDQAAPRYQLAVTVAQYAEVLRLSPWTKGCSIGQIQQAAERVAGMLPQDEKVSEFSLLVSRARLIRALADW